MKRISLKISVFLLLLVVLALSRALAQAPPPTGEWEKDENNPVLTPGETLDWDGGAVYAPSVLADEGLFKMWYTGRVATGTAVAVTAIGLATSSDGTEWLKDSRNPVLGDGLPGEWDAGGVSNATVAQVDDVYHLWYAGQDVDGTRRIGHATSSNGADWTKHEANPVLEPGPEGSWDERGVRPGDVVLIEDEYHMWYTGANAAGTAQIGLATSPDGVAWTKFAGNPVLRVGATDSDALGVYRPGVLFDGETYRMWYTGVGDDGVNRIGLATSVNGIDWVRDPDSPILDVGDSEAWDATAVMEPAVILDRPNATYHLWYTGEGEEVRRIGHATAKAGYRVYLPLIGRNSGSGN